MVEPTRHYVLAFLRRYPRVPARTAANTNASSYIVSTHTAMCGLAATIRRDASIPSRPGRFEVHHDDICLHGVRRGDSADPIFSLGDHVPAVLADSWRSGAFSSP